MQERAEARERGVTRGGRGGGGEGRGEKEAARETRETKKPGDSRMAWKQRAGLLRRLRAAGAHARTCVHRHGCAPLVNARVRRAARARARAFLRAESLRGHAADRRLNHASYFTSGRGPSRAIRTYAYIHVYTRTYFSISIYHPRVFSRRSRSSAAHAVLRSARAFVH